MRSRRSAAIPSTAARQRSECLGSTRVAVGIRVWQAVSMRVSSVDPRDQTWEVADPRYRVYFHDAHGAAEELEITGADVSEILGWAETERRGRTYVLYVCAPVSGLGLIRLQGSDPNEE